MCGIAGIVGRLSDSNRAALHKMNQALAHRGPDGDGSWESTANSRGWGAMFTHRRLSILDLSPTGAQPMVDPVTGDVITYNGEIYNFHELRDRLTASGQRFPSTGDTSVMLRALGVQGLGSIAELRGMFAFGFWNVGERKLTLARDPLGIKPLYVARNPDPNGDWGIIFASEIGAILSTGLLTKPKLNPRAAASVIWNGFVIAPETAVSGIETVWPGQYIVYDDAGQERGREFYWTAAKGTNSTPVDERELADVLAETVRLHLTSDVPVGVFLSAGIDSAAVANLAQKASVGPVNTFTLAFEDPEFNEAVFSAPIAKAIGTQHREILLTEDRFLSQLDSALDSLDQPTFDGVNSYYISQAVRDAGFKVALAGTGGDELFGGYTSFRDLPSLHQWSERGNWIPRGALVGAAKLASAVLQPTRGPVPQQTRWGKLPDMVRSGNDLLSLYQLAYALFLPGFQQELLGSNVVKDGLPEAMRERLALETRSRSSLSAISVFEQRLFLGERLLKDTDATSMAASIEVRLPLVDQVLFENVDRMDDSERYQPIRRKSVLRRIGLRGLDPALFERPKTGFVLPYERWLRTGLRQKIDSMLRDPRLVKPTGLDPVAVGTLWQAFLDGAPGLYWSRIWAIYAFVWWCHRHKVYA